MRRKFAEDCSENVNDPLANAWVRARMQDRFNSEQGFLDSVQKTWEATAKERELQRHLANKGNYNSDFSAFEIPRVPYHIKVFSKESMSDLAQLKEHLDRSRFCLFSAVIRQSQIGKDGKKYRIFAAFEHENGDRSLAYTNEYPNCRVFSPDEIPGGQIRGRCDEIYKLFRSLVEDRPGTAVLCAKTDEKRRGV